MADERSIEQIKGELRQEEENLQALRKKYLGTAIKDYEDSIRDLEKIKAEEEAYTKAVTDALIEKTIAQDVLKDQQDELAKAQQENDEAKISQLQTEISNSQREVDLASQAHTIAVESQKKEQEQREKLAENLEKNVASMDAQLRKKKDFVEQEQKISGLQTEQQESEDFSDSISTFGETIDNFYQTLQGTSLASNEEEPSWVKIIVGAILSASPQSDPFRLEKAREEQTARANTQQTIEEIRDNTEDIADSIDDIDTDVGGKGISGFLALLAGAAFGFISEIVKQVWAVAKGLGKLFKLIGGGIKTAFTKVFGGLITKIKSFIPQSVFDKIDEGVDIFRGFVSRIRNFFGRFMPIANAADDVGDAAKGGLGIFKRIKGFFSIFDDLIKPLRSMFKLGASVGTKIGRVLGPIGLIITVIDATFKGVKGLISGFKEDGILGGIKGAIMGIFDSLVGSVVNLGADIIGWMVKKLGFENTGQKIMDFDFMNIVSGLLDAILTPFRTIQEISALITQTFAGFNPLDAIKNAIVALTPNIFGLKEFVATQMGTTVEEATAKNEENKEKFVEFGSKVKEIIARRIVNLVPKAFGIREKFAELLNVPLDDTGSAINQSEIKRENDLENFVTNRIKEAEAKAQAEGATEEEMILVKSFAKADAKKQFDDNYDKWQQEGKNIVKESANALKITQEEIADTQKNIIEKHQENVEGKEKAQRSGSTAINAPTNVNNTNTTVSSDTIAVPSAVQDAQFLQNMAGDLVTSLGW
tara:strand:- start:1073 stop:3352 length:2280 start_codon:yes stop_codon:yes gene_type:complete